MAKLPKPIVFEWDKWNVDKNLIKHRVTNKEIEEIFENKPLKTFEDIRHSKTEDRFVAIGITEKKRRLLINFTIRGQKIRVISARNQSRKERRLYEEK